MIYIIRHGQTAKNKANILQGRSNEPLNAAGIVQAQEAGGFIGNCAVYSAKVVDDHFTVPVEEKA